MRKYPKAASAALFLFALAVLPVLLRLVGQESGGGFLPALSALVQDCSGFLTVLCVAAAGICLYKKAGGLAAFYLLDAAFINQLYLNVQWPLLLGRLSDLWGALKAGNVLIYLFFAISALFGLRAIWKSFRPAVRTPEPGGRRLSGGGVSGAANPRRASASPAPSEETGFRAGEASEPQAEPVQGGSETPPPAESGGGKRSAPTGTDLLIGLFLGCIAAFAANIFFQRVLEVAPPPGLEWFFRQLYPLAVVCAGGLVCLVAVRMLSGVWLEGGMRATALLSLMAEIAIIAFLLLNGGQEDFQVFDKIVSLISGNELIALVVAPVLLFIVLDIMFSILAKMFSRNPGPEWLSDSKGKLLDIEKGLMDLVLNLITGFVNLLLFLPDFFNQIGFLMLGEDDFFPQNKIPVQQQKKPPNSPDPSAAGDSPETPDPAPPTSPEPEDIAGEEGAK